MPHTITSKHDTRNTEQHHRKPKKRDELFFGFLAHKDPSLGSTSVTGEIKGKVIRITYEDHPRYDTLSECITINAAKYTFPCSASDFQLPCPAFAIQRPIDTAAKKLANCNATEKKSTSCARGTLDDGARPNIAKGRSRIISEQLPRQGPEHQQRDCVEDHERYLSITFTLSVSAYYCAQGTYRMCKPQLPPAAQKVCILAWSFHDGLAVELGKRQ